MESQEKLFAFKVASKEKDTESRKNEGKWVAREGVSVAGCTDYRFPGNLRYPHRYMGADQGIYC